MDDTKIIIEWLNNTSGSGYGDGDGSGSGSGYGDGSGYGYGYGSGYADGSGDGDGSGYGSGYGYGYGSGSGYGYGYGSGDGVGSGYGDGTGCGTGDGVKKFKNNIIYLIDRVPTIIHRIKNNIAKGEIVNGDFTTTPCYIVKGNGYFSHGKTIKEAQASLVEKYMENMDEEEIIEKFMSEFEPNKKYKGSVFFNYSVYANLV